MGRRGPKPQDPNGNLAQTAEEHIRRLAAVGIPDDQIACVIGISESQLQNKFSALLHRVRTEANAKVGQTLFKKAIEGDTACAIFWAKCRMQFREINRTEITGADGGPMTINVVIKDKK